MRVQLFYFAGLREERGCSQEEIEVSPEQTLLSIFTGIFGRPPEGIRFAINQSYVEADSIPVDGDEIAFLPPLGGG
jgi:molybdopterin synthase sulfur carrier subunit